MYINIIINATVYGVFSASELKAAMESLGERLTDEQIDEMIESVDLDGDGMVSYEGRWRSPRVWSIGTPRPFSEK